MIDVAIDLNLHQEGSLDRLSTRLYVYNWKINPFAAGETVIITNQTEKVLFTYGIFLSNNTKIRTKHLF